MNVRIPTLQPWEWCLAHLINCALVEAFGVCLEAKKSKHPAARKAINRVKKLLEWISKSGLKKVNI
jgi:hypothetical protein